MSNNAPPLKPAVFFIKFEFIIVICFKLLSCRVPTLPPFTLFYMNVH